MSPATIDEWLPKIAQIMRNPGLPIDPAEARADLISPSLTYCPVCAIPIFDNWALCKPCATAHGQLADDELPGTIAFLTYAGATPQSMTDVYEYKHDPPSNSAEIRLAVLVFFFVGIHGRCLSVNARQPISSVLSVPSGRGRTPHPLDNFLRYFPDEWKTVTASFTGPIRNVRATGIHPEYFELSRSVAGEHVLILEDSWVQGRNALSLAASARRHGAVEVSVLSIARILDQSFGANVPWLRTTAAASLYDPAFCPVTRGACPSPADPVQN